MYAKPASEMTMRTYGQNLTILFVNDTPKILPIAPFASTE